MMRAGKEEEEGKRSEGTGKATPGEEEETPVLVDGTLEEAAARTQTSASYLQDMLRKLYLQQAPQQPAATPGRKEQKDYKFWSTQPVPELGEEIQADGPIQQGLTADVISPDPLPLPREFEWCTVDLQDPEQLKELYTLLSLNYVEDEDATFRFDYSAAFLAWALQPPGWQARWHVGVRVATGPKRKLVAFIAGMPMHLRLHEHTQFLVEINFLCVHKKLRSKRLAPLMIREITRRVNRMGTFQAVYTAGALLPKPVSICRYWHRSLRPKKLVETGFSYLPAHMTMARLILENRLPEATTTPGLRPMEARDVAQVHVLLNAYLAQFQFTPVFSPEDVSHYFLPVPDTVYSYVGVDAEGRVTDFLSFYSLPSSIARHPQHTHLQIAYLFYYAPASPATLTPLIRDGLILAHRAGFDVFNCLDIHSNAHFLQDLRFGMGDGSLHYYLYNYRCRDVAPGEMGLVML